MNAIFLADFAYPCVAYVIRRLGLAQSVEQLFTLKGEPYDSTSQLSAGDIIIWERSDGISVSDATLTIGPRGPVTTKLRLGRHFGIYEGDGLVSDLTFDSEHYYPHIRLMSLSEHPVPCQFLQGATLHCDK